MKNFNLPFLLFSCFYLVSCTFYSQENSEKGVFQIENWIKQDSIAKAQRLLDEKITLFKVSKNYDSLISYIELVGSYALANGDKKASYKKAETLVNEILLVENPIYSSLALQKLGYLHSGTSDAKETYAIFENALAYAKQSNDPVKAELANVKYRLGYEAQNGGDFQLAKKHYREAAQTLDSWQSKDVEFYQQIYNALGGMMWMESKLDSSSYYFKKSLIELEKADETDLMNSFFRPALIKMNLSVLKNALGESQEAITLSQESVKGFEDYIEKSTDEFRIQGAKRHRATAIENMGSYYHSIGEFKKADALISYANAEKKGFLEPNSSGMIISRIILAQAKMGIRDFETAKDLLEEALKIMEDNPGAENYWKSGALTTLGGVYEALENNEKAYSFYTKGKETYKRILKGQYNKDFFDELIDISNFYATAGYPDKALEVANEIYEEAKNSDFKNTLQDFYHTVNLAEIALKIEDFDKAIQYANEALQFKLENNNTIIVEYRKPKALYILAAANYKKDNNLNAEQLGELLEKIEEGLSILETRKATIKNYDDLSLFIEENTQLFDLAKKIRLDLYLKTQDENYLNDILSLHESAMYSRIRSRLNLRNDLLSKNIPEHIIARERELKNSLNKIITEETSTLESFFEVNNSWSSFIDTLKNKYPKYYKLHYATLEESVDNIQSFIDNNTTVVRYLFIEEKLFALVMNSTERNLFSIEFKEAKNLISEVSSQEFDVQILAPKLQQLYQTLWSPFDETITTPNVVIVPDGELFNLSFEMLTPQLISSFSELATNSLLAKYNISYQFSLLMMKSKQNVINTYDSNYVAFAPEFSDKMKQEYQLAIKDSSSIDETYLNLLPQPFSVDVIKKYSREFNGTSFLNEKASKQLFQKSAGEHKIIHIGTHAESDNISPELSRLVFAKNNNEDPDSNYLYTYEIYNYNLASNLAILTACETGKPTYQAGEGMISLAHAFNYAGSESILTSLWEIDEESSSKIVSNFYQYLSEGLSKDESLRRAKLDYIANASGRTAAPQYWAGLVFIGNTSAIEIENNNPTLFWVIGSLLIILLLFIFFRKRK